MHAHVNISFILVDYPESCMRECTCFSNHYKGVLVANCSYSHLTRVPSKLPAHLDWLILTGNNISFLNTEKAQNNTLYHLSQFDLQNNNIKDVSEEVINGFIESNSILHWDLSQNDLNGLPKNIRQLSSLKTLNISGNKFKCSCQSYWMKEWLLNETDIVSEFDSIKCQMKSGKWINVVQMDKADIGCIKSRLQAWKILGNVVLCVFSSE